MPQAVRKRFLAGILLGLQVLTPKSYAHSNSTCESAKLLNQSCSNAESLYVKFSKRRCDALLSSERRGPVQPWAHSEEIYGSRLQEVDFGNLPSSLRIVEYRSLTGEYYYVAEQATKDLSSARVKILRRELPMDELTGVVDANQPVGREVLDTLVREKGPEITLVVIDLDNVGYINQNFAQKLNAGNDFIRNMVEAVRTSAGDTSQIFRTGGDEFALVLHERNPSRVQATLAKILNTVNSPKIRQMFRDEKISRAEAYKKSPDQEAFLAFTPYSRPSISIGATTIGEQDSLQAALNRAESQAREMKIQTKKNLNLDTSKYGGGPPASGLKPNLMYHPAALKPVNSQVNFALTPKPPSFNLGNAEGFIEEVRQDVIFRTGKFSIVRYLNSLNQQVIRLEEYRTGQDGRRVMSSRELFFNHKTEMVDATNPRWRELTNEFIKYSTPEHPRFAIRISALHLGKVNYFEAGLMAGDLYLSSVAQVIRQKVATLGLTGKYRGSDFLVYTQDLSQTQVESLVRDLRMSLSSDPSIHKIFMDQRLVLNQKISAETDPEKKQNLEKSLRELEEITAKFDIRFTNLHSNDSFESMIAHLK